MWDVSPGTKSVKSATNVRSKQRKAEDRATEGTRDEKDVDDDWTLPSANGDEEWAAMLELLRQFKQRHKHTNVPRNLGELGAWVDAQRIALKNMLECAPAHPGQPRMTWERFSRLEALGFEFSVRGSLSSDGEAQNISRKSQ